MLRPRPFVISSFIFSTLILAASVATWGQAVPLITQPVNESQRVVLRGNTRPEATSANDRGAVDDSFPLNGIELLLKRSPEHEQAAAALADELQQPGSPQFHKWLTANQYAAQFGVHAQDVSAISDWLSSHGFTVDDTGPMTITFSGHCRAGEGSVRHGDSHTGSERPAAYRQHERPVDSCCAGARD